MKFPRLAMIVARTLGLGTAAVLVARVDAEDASAECKVCKYQEPSGSAPGYYYCGMAGQNQMGHRACYVINPQNGGCSFAGGTCFGGGWS